MMLVMLSLLFASAPDHWTVQPKVANRYVLASRVAHLEGRDKELILRITEGAKIRSVAHSVEYTADVAPWVKIFRWKSLPKTLFVMAVAPAGPQVGDVYRFANGALVRSWSCSGHDIALDRTQKGGTAIMLLEGTDLYGLQHEKVVDSPVYDVWRMFPDGKMHCRRIAIRRRDGRFKMLPKTWGIRAMKAMRKW